MEQQTTPVKAEDRLSELRSQATQGDLTTKFFDEAQFLLLSSDGLFAVLTQEKRVQDANHVAAMHNTQEELLEVVRAARESTQCLARISAALRLGMEPTRAIAAVEAELVRLREPVQALDAKVGAL